jgi:hypothetical protein
MCSDKVETTVDISSITHSGEIKMINTETSETFEESLEKFAMVAKRLIKETEQMKNCPIGGKGKEYQKCCLTHLLDEFKMESIDLLMSEVSPETRKEIMDFAWNGDFDTDVYPSGQYLKDWYRQEDGLMIKM